MVETATISLKCEALLCLWCRVPGIPEQDRVLVLEDPDGKPEPERLQEWLRRCAPHHTSRIQVVVSQVGALGRTEPAWVRAVLSLHLQVTHMGRATTQRFATVWPLNVLRALQRNPRWATTAREPWAGRPVFIVGAGSSLDDNGHLLSEAQKRGPVVALNSSAGCCAHHGVVPDLLYCCEANHFPEHVRPFVDNGRTEVVLDALSSPATWAAAPNAIAAMLHEPYCAPYLVQLGVMPLHYSTSSSTAAASLAHLWGASEIVLVGHNHAAGHPVSDYAQGSPFYGNRGRIDADGHLLYEGGGKEPYKLPACWRQGWNGGEPVLSEHTFSPVIEWYGELAQRATVIIATEGGADIPGTTRETLASVIERSPVVEPVVPEYEPAADARPVLDAITAQARRVIETGATEWPLDFHLLGMWIVPALDRCGPRGNRAAAVAEAVQQGAREILETLEAA